MNLKEMEFEKQVTYLRSLLSSGKNSLLGYFALFAFRHHLALKHSPRFSQKPVIRWYLGQLAKEYIRKYFNEAKENLENFAEIGLLNVKEGPDISSKEYHLNEAVYPALLEVLEEVFGKEYISSAISRAKFYRDPKTKEERKPDQNSPEVKR
jgi:hypothetical protein